MQLIQVTEQRNIFFGFIFPAKVWQNHYHVHVSCYDITFCKSQCRLVLSAERSEKLKLYRLMMKTFRMAEKIDLPVRSFNGVPVMILPDNKSTICYMGKIDRWRLFKNKERKDFTTDELLRDFRSLVYDY